MNICPYCNLKFVGDVDSFLHHLIFAHDYPIGCSKEYVKKRFADFGWTLYA